jgi:hypothetical protein
VLCATLPSLHTHASCLAPPLTSSSLHSGPPAQDVPVLQCLEGAGGPAGGAGLGGGREWLVQGVGREGGFSGHQ